MDDYLSEMLDLVEKGWTVTSLLVGGRYVVTATTHTLCACGSSSSYRDSWAMLKEHIAEVSKL